MSNGKKSFFDSEDIVSSTEPKKQSSFFDAEDIATPVAANAEPEISAPETTLRGALQGITFGFSDELAGGLDALAKIATTDKTLADLPEVYKEQRDILRAKNTAAQEANPALYTTSEFVGGLPGFGVKAAAKGASLAQKAIQSAKQSAKFGAAASAGYSEADTLPELAQDVALGTALSAGTGAALPALGAGISKTGDFAKRKALDVAAGSAIGAAVGAAAPGVDSTTGAVGGALTGLFTPARKLVPGIKGLEKSFQFGREGKAIAGEKAKKEIQDSLESSVIAIANKLDKIQDDASEAIGKAIKEEVAAPVKGPEFVSKIEQLLSEAKNLGSDDVTKAVGTVEKKLDRFKKVVTDYELLKGEQVKGGIEEAAEKLTKKTREEQLVSQALGEPVSITPAQMTPEKDYLTSMVKKTSASGEDVVKPFVQKIEDLNGARTLIELKPKEILQSLETLTPDEVYQFRKELNSMIGGTKDSFTRSQLYNIRDTVDKFIEPSLTEAGRDLLKSGKSTFSKVLSVKDELPGIKELLGADAFQKELTLKNLSTKLSSPSESAENLRTVLGKTLGDFGLEKEASDLIQATERKALSNIVDDRTALSSSGALGQLGTTVYGRTLLGANIAGQALKKLSDKVNNPKLSNLLNKASTLEGPAKAQLMREISTSFNLDDELKDIDLDLIDSAGAQELPLPVQKQEDTTSLLDDTKKLREKASELKGTPEGNMLNSILMETRPVVRNALLAKLEQDYPGLNIPVSKDSKKPSFMSDDEIVNHLAMSEGSALNASKNRVIIPGSTGVYDDGRGNPTTMFGANLRSPVTRQAYRDLGIDPLRATEEQHKQAAVYNWKLHAKYSDRALNNLGLSLDTVEPRKAQLAQFLLRDIGYRGGVKSYNSDKMAEMVSKLNAGDYVGFANDYIKTNHFQTGGQPRQQSLLGILKELAKKQ